MIWALSLFVFLLPQCSCKPSISPQSYAWHCLLSTSAEWLGLPPSTTQYKTRSTNGTALSEGTALQKRHKPETLHLCFPPSPVCSLRGKRESSAWGQVCSVHFTVTSSLMVTGLRAQERSAGRRRGLAALPVVSSLRKSIVWLSGFHDSSLRV